MDYTKTSQVDTHTHDTHAQHTLLGRRITLCTHTEMRTALSHHTPRPTYVL